MVGSGVKTLISKNFCIGHVKEGIRRALGTKRTLIPLTDEWVDNIQHSKREQNVSKCWEVLRSEGPIYTPSNQRPAPKEKIES
jgi:hypothetical protein